MLSKSFISVFVIVMAGCPSNSNRIEIDCFSSNGIISCPSKGLHKIPDAALSDDIHTLDLSDNLIQSLQALGKSRYLFSLRNILLSGNLINNTSLLFLRGMYQLRRLDLSRNEISYIRKQMFQDLVALDYLSLAHNKIYCIEENSFSFLKSLTELDLSYNHLENQPEKSACLLHRELCKLSSLIALTLSGNKLNESLSEKKHGNANLTRQSGGFFTCMSQLTNIQASNCSLTSISHNAFFGLHHLVNLDLSDNLINTWDPRTLSDSRSLVYIDLGSNQLESFPATSFQNSQHLTHISLRNNELRSVRADWIKSFAGFSKLPNVSSLQEKYEKTNDEFSKSTEWKTILADANYYLLDWSGNPLTCDCEMEPFLTWIYNGLRIELFRALSGYHDILCHEIAASDSSGHKSYKRKHADQSLAKRLQKSCRSIRVPSQETLALNHKAATPTASLLPKSFTTGDIRNIVSTESRQLTMSVHSFARLLGNISTRAEIIFERTTSQPTIESFSITSICNSTNCVSQSKSAMQTDNENTDKKGSIWSPWIIGIFVGIDLVLLLALLMKIYTCHKNHKRVSPQRPFLNR